MFRFVAAGCLAFFLSGGAAQAASADCLMVIRGKAYIDGPCSFDPSPGGSFQIAGKVYFGQVTIEDGRGMGFWNAVPGATHAQTWLGELTRKGACWQNETAKLCAWKAGTRPK